MLGSKVNKPSKILIKIVSAVEYIELIIKPSRHYEPMILSSGMYE